MQDFTTRMIIQRLRRNMSRNADVMALWDWHERLEVKEPAKEAPISFPRPISEGSAKKSEGKFNRDVYQREYMRGYMRRYRERKRSAAECRREV